MWWQIVLVGEAVLTPNWDLKLRPNTKFSGSEKCICGIYLCRKVMHKCPWPGGWDNFLLGDRVYQKIKFTSVFLSAINFAFVCIMASKAVVYNLGFAQTKTSSNLESGKGQLGKIVLSTVVTTWPPASIVHTWPNHLAGSNTLSDTTGRRPR